MLRHTYHARAGWGATGWSVIAIAALLPVSLLGAYHLWGETGLIVLTPIASVALALAMRAVLTRVRPQAQTPFRRISGRDDVVAHADNALSDAQARARQTACMVFDFDSIDEIKERYGPAVQELMISQATDRAESILREVDQFGPLDETRFAVILSPVARADLESMIQIATRLQNALSEPFRLDGITIHATASIGFCQSARSPRASGRAMLDAAEAAHREAARSGPAGIRAFSPRMESRAYSHDSLASELEDAMENGQIVPWFQPQFSTDTGDVTGLEALARWEHPQRGCLLPGEFLPVVERAGLFERLGELILFQSLSCFASWNRAGLGLPGVAVNVSSDEFRNPKLAERVQWELDRFDLAPDILTLEVLESVIATSDEDMIVRNIKALSDLGCRIDLDDFGTGHSSISSIRRFAVERIKIDRSFVARVDKDASQRQMLVAILELAERLELGTIAEGVETHSEHALLSQLGCQEVQGFGLCRPMPERDVPGWLTKHRAKLGVAPKIGRGIS